LSAYIQEMTGVSTIVLTIKGEVRKVNLQLEDDGSINIETLQKYFKKKDSPEQICYYEHDTKIIFIFGYKKGKKGTENKTELPEPNTDITLFGDAIVLVSPTHNWNNPMPFTVEQWTAFVNKDENIDNSDDDDEDDEDDQVSEEEKSVKDDFEQSDNDSIADADDEDADAVDAADAPDAVDVVVTCTCIYKSGFIGFEGGNCD
jgi:hypothetical protein